jgi:hypothetical protein
MVKLNIRRPRLDLHKTSDSDKLENAGKIYRKHDKRCGATKEEDW